MRAITIKTRMFMLSKTSFATRWKTFPIVTFFTSKMWTVQFRACQVLFFIIGFYKSNEDEKTLHLVGFKTKSPSNSTFDVERLSEMFDLKNSEDID